MAMLQKWATGTREQDTTKEDGAGESILYCGGEFTYEQPNSAPTDSAAEKPYTKWLAKNMSTTALRNLGAGDEDDESSSKEDGVTVVDDHVNKWYRLGAMWKYRKILKRYNKYRSMND